jgi:hypothetical protein
MRPSKLLVRLLEHLCEQFYEGPIPPMRFAEEVVIFAKTYPNATVEQWAEFSVRQVQASYRAGYARGYEWQARDLDKLPSFSPERVADEMANNPPWTAPESLTSDELAQAVEGDFLRQLPDDESRAKYLDSLGRYYGGFRVVVVPERKS